MTEHHENQDLKEANYVGKVYVQMGVDYITSKKFDQECSSKIASAEIQNETSKNKNTPINRLYLYTFKQLSLPLKFIIFLGSLRFNLKFYITSCNRKGGFTVKFGNNGEH